MATQATTCTTKRAAADESKYYNQARRLNQEINTLEKTNGHTVLNSRPLRLGFDISSACNANCIFCLADKGRKSKKSVDAFRPPEWLDNFEPLLPFINLGIFSSYEALLNPFFDQFVLKLRKHYTPFQLFTNGKALTPDVSEFILRNGLDSIHCSFHSPVPGTYESIMRGITFDEVLNNLMQFKLLSQKHNPNANLVLVFCAMRRNIEQLLDYVDLAHRVGARAIQVNYLLATDEKHKLEKESMFFNQELYDTYVHTAKLKASKVGINLMHQPLFQTYIDQANGGAPCYRPWEHCIVSQTGEMTVCCGGAGGLGNVFEDDFFNVWNSKPLRAFRRTVNTDNPPAQCRKCTRGKENPKDISTHITYLRSLSAEEKDERIAELMARYGG